MAIVCAGLAETLDPGSPCGLSHVDDGDDSSLQPPGDGPLERQARRIVQMLTNCQRRPKMRMDGRCEDVIFFDGVFFESSLTLIFFGT